MTETLKYTDELWVTSNESSEWETRRGGGRLEGNIDFMKVRSELLGIGSIPSRVLALDISGSSEFMLSCR